MLLRLGSEAGDREDLDRLTRQLVTELQDQQVESVRLVRDGSAPPGTKAADTVSIGMITLAVVPQLLPFVVDFMRSWFARQRRQDVHLTGTLNGHSLDFRGSVEDLSLLVRTLVSPTSSDSLGMVTEQARSANLE